ncbi:MAG: hypothetical protein SAJ12_00370 [Jaaginema sp. PMC 1079.18]|nr:hypothetical protein [Jaaginema sp. PMC 1080.18]MEC4849437.1 hypothetical protein [Jaaginema sp. PMC 1079.18]MEC4865464.1 hypothetical protein [Jaaginema sp. PMC 1078.18]
MKHLVFNLTSLILLMAIASPVVKANPTIAVNRENTMMARQQTTPFNLVSLGYRGYFSKRGIGGYTQFVSGIRANRITAESLVETAIAAGKLSPETRQNTSYINAVKLQLDALENDG